MPHPLILQGFGGVAPKVYFATTYIHSILQQPTFYLCKKHFENLWQKFWAATTENEDNDDYGSATRISLGTAVKGNIQSEDDVDFYKIVLKNGQT